MNSYFAAKELFSLRYMYAKINYLLAWWSFHTPRSFGTPRTSLPFISCWSWFTWRSSLPLIFLESVCYLGCELKCILWSCYFVFLYIYFLNTTTAKETKNNSQLHQVDLLVQEDLLHQHGPKTQKNR